MLVTRIKSYFWMISKFGSPSGHITFWIFFRFWPIGGHWEKMLYRNIVKLFELFKHVLALLPHWQHRGWYWAIQTSSIPLFLQLFFLFSFLFTQLKYLRRVLGVRLGQPADCWPDKLICISISPSRYFIPQPCQAWLIKPEICKDSLVCVHHTGNGTGILL